jgi:hypothetical protein
MLYKEIIAVCSHIHTKHINTLCGQNLAVYLYLHTITTGLYNLNKECNILVLQPRDRKTDQLHSDKLWAD